MDLNQHSGQAFDALPDYLMQEALGIAFAEDWGLSGDLSSRSCINPEVQVQAQLRLRGIPDGPQADCVLAGLELTRAAFLHANSGLSLRLRQRDGDIVAPGTILAEISGSAAELLSRERVALNYLGHLSGIASLTRQYVRAVAHTAARIVDTRKTLPGLRALQKFAVRCGGGHNHRFGLFDAIMIKDNHIAAAGGIEPALRAARRRGGHMVSIELEVDTLEQLYRVDFDKRSLRPDCVLLDNMDLADLQTAVAHVAGRALCEASGNVTLERVAQIAHTGVDLISVGALTHSARNIDIGLDFL